MPVSADQLWTNVCKYSGVASIFDYRFTIRYSGLVIGLSLQVSWHLLWHRFYRCIYTGAFVGVHFREGLLLGVDCSVDMLLINGWTAIPRVGFVISFLGGSLMIDAGLLDWYRFMEWWCSITIRRSGPHRQGCAQYALGVGGGQWNRKRFENNDARNPIPGRVWLFLRTWRRLWPFSNGQFTKYTIAIKLRLWESL